MISAAGSEVGGQSKKGFKDDLQEKVEIPSGPVLAEGGAGRRGWDRGPTLAKGHLTGNRHKDCKVQLSDIR